MQEHHEESIESGPTYKILFLASISVIGAFIGWWATDLKQNVSRVWERIDKLENRTATVEAGAVEHRYQHYQLDQKIDRAQASIESNTKLLREMERAIPRRDRP